jgi:hypothetical protein
MSQAIPANDAVVEVFNGANSQELSRANLFGLFLTLQLCLFTQPYGSLLFRRTGGLFWRCNPIAAFVEGLLIAFYLLQTIVKCIRTALQQRGQRFRPRLWANISDELHATACALLLLRGECYLENSLIEGLMTDDFLEQEESRLPENATGGEPAAHEMTALPTSTALDGTVEPQVGVLRRRTTELEANIPVNAPGRTSEPSQAQRLQEAYDANAMAHREWRIDLVTIISVLIVLVKILAMSGAILFRVVAGIWISAWLSLQVLLFLFHSHGSPTPEGHDLLILRTARRLRNRLGEANNWVGLFLILETPLLGYIGYVVAFRPWPQDPYSIVDFITSGVLYLVKALTWIGLPAVAVCSLLFLLRLLLRLPWILLKAKKPELLQDAEAERTYTVYALLFPVFLWAAAGALSMTVAFADMSMVAITFPENSKLEFLVRDCFGNFAYYVGRGSCLLFIVGMQLSLFFNLFDKDDNLPYLFLKKHKTFLLNGFYVVVTSLWYILLYNPVGTYKPGWTEWLG